MFNNLKAALGLVGLAALAFALFSWQATRTSNAKLQSQVAQHAEQIKTQAAQIEAQAESMRLGQRAAIAHVKSQTALEQRYAALQTTQTTRLANIPHLVATRWPTCTSDGGSSGDGSSNGSGAGPAPATGRAQPLGLDDFGPQLSHGFVWLWNSALTGHSAPVGACQPDATAAAAPALAAASNADACAPASGLGIAAALANHTANARSCQATREQLEQLIVFVQTHPAFQGPKP